MRSFWKGPVYIHFSSNKKQNFKIADRKAVIFPSFIGKTFLIKNGNKSLKKIYINSKMVGLKFGEFCFCKKTSK